MQMVSKEQHHVAQQQLASDNNKKKAVVKTVEISARTGKPKRRKALRACTNCQRTHLTCDDNRPCERCVKRGCAETCVDGVRKATKMTRSSSLHSQRRHTPHNGTGRDSMKYSHGVDHTNTEFRFPMSMPDGINPPHFLNMNHDSPYFDAPQKNLSSPLHYSGNLTATENFTDHQHINAAHVLHAQSPSHPNYHIYHRNDILPVTVTPAYDGHNHVDHHHHSHHSSYMGDEPHSLHQHNLEHPEPAPDDHFYSQMTTGVPLSEIPSYVPTSHLSEPPDYIHQPRRASQIYRQTVANPTYPPGPQYYEPLDSYPSVPARQLTMKPPLDQPTSDKDSVVGHETEHENESVISAMSRSRDEEHSVGTTASAPSEESSVAPSTEKSPVAPAAVLIANVTADNVPKLAEDHEGVIPKPYAQSSSFSESSTTSGDQHVSHSVPLQSKHQTDPTVKPEQISSSWSDIPVNALATAHNEQSGRYFYGAKDFKSHGDVFRRVTKPFPYLQAFQRHYEVLQLKSTPEQSKLVGGILTKIVNSGLAVTRPLSVEDAVFVEQCFQRSLLEEKKQFSLAATACMVWRRSGDIVAVSPRFTKMTQWTIQHLSSDYITSVMDAESVVTYFQRVESIYSTNNKEFKFTCTLLTPNGETIRTEVEVTAQKDLFNMPLTILGKFWEKPP